MRSGMKYWEIIADNLHDAGWRLGCVSALDLPSKTPTRPQLLLNSAALDGLGALVIYLRSEKGGSKIPMHSDRVDDERGCNACNGENLSIPHDLSGDNKLERL